MSILVSIAWPLLTFIFAVFFVIFFRKPITEFISRIKSIDKSGIKTSQNPEAQREEQKKEAVEKLLLAIGDSIVLQEVEKNIVAGLHADGLATDGDTVKVLIKHCAATQILLEFEEIHNLIFGSQIYLLKNLNEVIGQGMSTEFIETHFEHVKSIFSEKIGNWTLEQYLSFLFDRRLIVTQDNRFHITNLGHEYLTWIVRNGRREDNPL
ncbi:MAG: hypothetical protein HZC51_13565 [Nitrospirae bacterium]|nr:hypothetical protein [Nitrospirota bacterium]